LTVAPQAAEAQKLADDALLRKALDALNNSVDLAAEEARNMADLYSHYPTRAHRIAALQELENKHRAAITALIERLGESE
jgi:16S rRNA C1402 (ribose-2'-O) methylase RsmI